ncbi:MAG: hypothetical protein JST00_26080 [Deltaproteobacteria bacterium]|nr:hypothetical protein [Deltaproteobacteria bacterium]
MRPATRLLARTAVTVLVAVAALGACTLDWEVRPDPGVPSEAASPDVATDAGADAATPDAPLDATEDDGAACAALLANVTSARAAARSCQLGQAGQCTSTVKDECDCNVVVRLASDPKTDAFVAAVASYRVSCSPSCAACPQEKPPATWACLQSGSVIECFP